MKLTGESGYTPLERIWLRPTCEVNGIKGGYTGDGAKTVLPGEVMAPNEWLDLGNYRRGTIAMAALYDELALL